MKVSIVYLYREVSSDIAFSKDIINELKITNEVQVITGRESTDSFFDELKVERLLNDSLLVNKLDRKKTVNLFNVIYEKISNSDLGEAVVVPIHSWKLLKSIQHSYLQLTNQHILFCVRNVPDGELRELVKLVEYLERFRNIHIGIYDSVVDEDMLNKIYCLHFLQREKLDDILPLRLNNRRKYIGWRYSLNELRQKIKFHKDLVMYRIRERLYNHYINEFNKNTSIPKVIHYCWFGSSKLPDHVVKCIDTWKRFMPDYEIKCWNDTNFPFDRYRFAQEAKKNNKWAFVADIARLHALYYEGGIYFDTDVEVIKSFDVFLNEDGFSSYESLNLIAMAAIGFKKHHPWVGKMLFWYEGIHCDDDYTEIANTKIVSKITKMIYGTKLDGKEKALPCGFHIYPREYFSPKLERDVWLVTDNTYCIHHFTGLW